MMGGVSPETCWASYKYGIINFDTVASCWIFPYEWITWYATNKLQWKNCLTHLHHTTTSVSLQNVTYSHANFIENPILNKNVYGNYKPVFLFLLLQCTVYNSSCWTQTSSQSSFCECVPCHSQQTLNYHTT